MLPVLQQFAVSAEADPGLLQALGIDYRLLVFQAIAFLVLLWFLAKFVYPPLSKMLDERQKAIDDSAAAAGKAEANAREAEERIEKLLTHAQSEASDIVGTAHKESVAMVAEAETKAAKRAEYIAAQAREQLQLDIAEAKQQLQSQTIELVGLATERIIKTKLDGKKDAELVADALSEAAPVGSRRAKVAK